MGWYLDKGVRKERHSKTLYLNFGLPFEFWDMNKPDSKFFRPVPVLLLNVNNRQTMLRHENVALMWLEPWNLAGKRNGRRSIFPEK